MKRWKRTIKKICHAGYRRCWINHRSIGFITWNWKRGKAKRKFREKVVGSRPSFFGSFFHGCRSKWVRVYANGDWNSLIEIGPHHDATKLLDCLHSTTISGVLLLCVCVFILSFSLCQEIVFRLKKMKKKHENQRGQRKTRKKIPTQMISIDKEKWKTVSLVSFRLQFDSFGRCCCCCCCC